MRKTYRINLAFVSVGIISASIALVNLASGTEFLDIPYLNWLVLLLSISWVVFYAGTNIVLENNEYKTGLGFGKNLKEKTLFSFEEVERVTWFSNSFFIFLKNKKSPVVVSVLIKNSRELVNSVISAAPNVIVEDSAKRRLLTS